MPSIPPLDNLDEESTADGVGDGSVDYASIAFGKSPIKPHEFESDLEDSRPYRKATRDTVDFSFRSSVATSYTWSAMSFATSTNVSVRAFRGLPTPPDPVFVRKYNIVVVGGGGVDKSGLTTQVSGS